MSSNVIKASLVEFLGTFALVFVGIFAAINAGSNTVLAAALGHGLIVLGLIYAFGHLSGANFNPAVTAGLLVGGKLDIARAVFYWIAQFAGAIVAALVAQVILGDISGGQTRGSLTDANIGAAALFEAIMTFLFVSVIYQVAGYARVGQLAGIAIGLTLAANIIAGGPYTGASLNPARTLGPALIAGDLSYVLPYLIGIFAGGIVAGLLQSLVFTPDDPSA